jgi:predicted restriction endonuclease
MIRRSWTHDELLVVFNLYCRLPFGQLDSRNNQVIEMATLINRSPSAVSMKLCNFASFDPIHLTRGVKGLANASKADKDIWNEFNANWEDAIIKSNDLLVNMQANVKEMEFDLNIPDGPTDVEGMVKQRRGQGFFRQAILSAYNKKCCISGTSVPELLRASHILPWSLFPQERLNPQNGLCLSAIHDAAFDKGLINLNDDFQIVLSDKLRKSSESIPFLNQTFIVYEGKKISLPDKFLPKQEFLKVHRENIFI